MRRLSSLASPLRQVLAALAFLAAAIALPGASSAEETIKAFATAITLATDGSVDVTETLDIVAEGNEIRRGIYRDIPTTMRNDDGSRLISNLDVVAVNRDGKPEPYTLENLGNGFKRIRIGDADVMLSYGLHRYTIRYTMTRMGRSFADHDELFWNATGNYWVFPIETAVASVTLPEGAVISSLVGYTGVPGSTEQAVTSTRTSDRTATFRANRRLAPGEGMSVAVAFQRGILGVPSGSQAALYWLSDHRDLIVPAIALGLVLLYNTLAWGAVGRDPKRGTVIPLFHEPKGTTPALVHYVDRMGWDKTGWTAFTATLFNLGVKGLLAIDNSSKNLIVKAIATPSGALEPAERKVYDFVGKRGNVTISTAVGKQLNETRGEMVKAIEQANKGKWFVNNAGYSFVGFLLCVLVLGGLVLTELVHPVTLAIAAGVAFAALVLIGIARSLIGGPVATKIFLGIWVLIFGGNILGASVATLTQIQIDTPLIAVASIIVAQLVFFWLMRARTPAGRKLQDEIEGFRMYLDTAEKNRLNINGEPPMTIERFERILPFAIALGVEKPWTEHFEGELARHAIAGLEDRDDYRPGWYSNRNFSTASNSGISSTVSAMAAGMSAAMIAAQPTSSSGSGFSSGGGGGSSGGGGGGGGGGGW